MTTEKERFAVVPISDIKDHDDFNENCHCNPIVREEENEIVIIHNAYDPRELFEEINKN